MSCDVGEVTESFGEWAELIVIVIAELILQAFCRVTYVTAHSPTLPSLYLRHSSFSNPSVASPTSQLILSRAHSPSFPSLHLRHSSFSNPSLALLTSQDILQPFRCFTYATSTFSNPSFASPTLQDFNLPHLASRPWRTFRLQLGFNWTCSNKRGVGVQVLKIKFWENWKCFLFLCEWE